MILNMHSSWKQQLQSEFNQPYFMELMKFITEEYRAHICYPKEEDIFNAFEWCHFEDVKVVIIGQDPYHGVGQANGLCFSVNDGIAPPPSLKNIFKELETDVGMAWPNSGNLKSWAHQGVLLLNATLTVRAGAAGSHQNKGWEEFTNKIIQTISNKKEDVVFLLWGSYAKQKKKYIDTTRHTILTSGHPSPLSANRGYWFGNRSFSKTNSQLERVGALPIDWSLK